MTENISDLLQQIFQRSKDANRDFMRRAHLCSQKGWPDRKRELDVAFELQLLLSSQREMRFAYLMTGGVIQYERQSSLLKLSERLGRGWSDTEEAAFTESASDYEKLERDIQECQRALDPEAIDGPLRDLEKDPEYQQARQEYLKTLRELDAEFERASQHQI